MFKNILLAIWVIGTILLAVYGQYLAAAFSMMIGLQLIILVLVSIAVMATGMSALLLAGRAKINKKETSNEP